MITAILKRTYCVILLLMMTIFTLAQAKDSLVLGAVEYGTLLPMELKTKVRLDTGATTSSLHAEDLHYFQRNGHEWVRFTLQINEFKKTLEYPVTRFVRIKNRPSEGKSVSYTRRPVIKMQVCLAQQIREIEINLTDRNNFLYPMLLGRSAMKEFGILIDPTLKFSKKPGCETKKTKSSPTKTDVSTHDT